MLEPFHKLETERREVNFLGEGMSLAVPPGMRALQVQVPLRGPYLYDVRTWQGY